MANSKHFAVFMAAIIAGSLALVACGDDDEDKDQTTSDGIHITSHLTCPDDKHPHLIDLGLPSGTKWACCNIGALKPEDYGGYYAWGETEEKSSYTWENYVYYTGRIDGYVTCTDIGNNIANTPYDVASSLWGNGWHMPSLSQCKEIMSNCTCVWNSQKGINGWLVTGSNGGTIFLPAAGEGGDRRSLGTYGRYWSSSISIDERQPANKYRAYAIEFGQNFKNLGDDSRAWGYSVRPVLNK